MSIESRIQEQRTNEAIKKNYMGQEGKIYLIAKYIGHEIVRDSENSETIDFDSMFENNDGNTIPVLDEDAYSFGLGYNYNGLEFGYHLEITCMDFEQIIKLYYKGFLVYHEENGNLIQFIPNNMWEELVEKLYNRVKEILQIKLKKYELAEKAELSKLENEELNRLRSKWGNII
jgi:hypothetical protein